MSALLLFRVLVASVALTVFTLWLVGCAAPPERNMWREMEKAGDLP
jgi:chloramphenicol 3-O-phosphotransferase